MESRMWIVQAGDVVLRVMGVDAASAFAAASESINLETMRAVAFPVKYAEGVEMAATDERYTWEDGHAVLFHSPGTVWHNNQFTEEQPDSVRLDYPVIAETACLCVGYGISRPLLMRFRKEYPHAEIWTMNMDRAPGATRHFQVHTREPKWEATMAPGQWELSDLKALGVQVYTQENYPFNMARRDYFCSTVDYMLCLADIEGVETVCMPGLDFGGIRNPMEASSARYWVGVLEGKGAIVRRSPLSLLFAHKRYGVYTPEEMSREITK